jgi:hypothetical protein
MKRLYDFDSLYFYLESNNCNLIKRSKYKNFNYEILSDNLTRTYFLSLPELFIMYIPEDKIQEFTEKYENDTQLEFVIYRRLKYVIVICSSHLINEIENKNSILFNTCFSNYLSLTTKFSCFIIMNKSRIDIQNKKFKIENSDDNKMKFVKKIGLGKSNPDILDFIDFINSVLYIHKHIPINSLNF